MSVSQTIKRYWDLCYLLAGNRNSEEQWVREAEELLQREDLPEQLRANLSYRLSQIKGLVNGD